jgi:hypothetical protein
MLKSSESRGNRMKVVHIALALSLLLAVVGACSTSTLPGPDQDSVKSIDHLSDESEATVDVRIDGPYDDGNTNPDVPVTDLLPDLSACSPGSAQFGCPCDGNSDCESGLCILHLGNKICSQTCVEECPDGLLCDEINLGGADVIFGCRSRVPTLCLPCMASSQCGGGASKCIHYDPLEGSFCGGECGNEMPCPEGYDCLEATTVEGDVDTQCVNTDSCSCADYAVEHSLATMCSTSNQHGTCHSWRICGADGLNQCDAQVPALEVCDGTDNDCDELLDEEGDCADDEQCTADICLGTGGCYFEPLTGTDCDDGDLCTYDDHCEEGQCVGLEVTCEDFNSCTVDICTQDGCLYSPGNEGLPCDDDDDCTVDDHCSDGFCLAGGYNPDCYGGCGDGKCLDAEGPLVCPVDCGPCGDGICGFHEAGPDGGTCPKDCLAACGDGECEGGESAEFCSIDCSGCGDGYCGLNESSESCQGDCPPPCGNGICEPGENGSLCPTDCTPPCGDLVCQWGENAYSCPEDCALCPDGTCSAMESVLSCPLDCATPCGNSICDGVETFQTCPVDCGSCGDGFCALMETGDQCPQDCAATCGDDECQDDSGETYVTCPCDCLIDGDQDGVPALLDNCPAKWNPGQEDWDADGKGNECDSDDDNDGENDATDCGPLDATMSNLLPEVCDGADNDCDSEADEDFMEDGMYVSDQHCSKCGENCSGSFYPNSSGICLTKGIFPTCGIECEPGWFDVNGDYLDGCECEFTGEVDDPDVNGDANCDGMEGMEATGVFVAKSGDDANPGTRLAPLQTIQPAIALAVDADLHSVHIASGIYQESVVLSEGINLYGGYSNDFALRNPEILQTVLLGTSIIADQPGTINAFNIDELETTVSGLWLHGEDGMTPGASSYGLYTLGCTAALRLVGIWVVAGNGKSGWLGEEGENGQDGGDGVAGLVSHLLDSADCITEDHALGGTGGERQCNGETLDGGWGGSSSCPLFGVQPEDIEEGEPGAGNSGGSGGVAGHDGMWNASCSTCSTPDPDDGPMTASDGVSGDDGSDGFGGQSCDPKAIAVVGGLYTMTGGTAGLEGGPGSGGGGGGAGGGVESKLSEDCETQMGGSGGGGGSGGCYGNGGKKGTSGGASFGLFMVWEEEPENVPLVLNCQIVTGSGGNGGSGGMGGVGGPGGAGAPGGLGGEGGAWCAARGGHGGDGGRGGHGGGGGAGCGGSSYAIFTWGVQPDKVQPYLLANTAELLGDPGTGGEGGKSLGQTGEDGANGVSAVANF